MDKERLRELPVSKDIIGARPTGQLELSAYWTRYKDLVEEIIFSGEVNAKRIRSRGFNLALREDMTLANLADALEIGKNRCTSFRTEDEFEYMKDELEKVAVFIPIAPTSQAIS